MESAFCPPLTVVNKHPCTQVYYQAFNCLEDIPHCCNFAVKTYKMQDYGKEKAPYYFMFDGNAVTNQC